MNCGLIDQLWL